MHEDPELLAKTLVDQHYAAGPEQMKEAIARLLAERGLAKSHEGSPREQLVEEVAELEKTSLRGSE